MSNTHKQSTRFGTNWRNMPGWRTIPGLEWHRRNHIACIKAKFDAERAAAAEKEAAASSPDATAENTNITA